jgi:uncharacterized protein YaaR (DUF327 family)
MPDIDPLATSYFYAPQSEKERGSAKKRREVSSKPRAGLFSSLIEKSRTGETAQGIGIPAEVAGLSDEDAVVALKDELDVTGDALKNSPTARNFSAYKGAVKNFVSYLVNKNYEVRSDSITRRVKEQGVWIEKPKTLVLVKAIDEKLDRLAQDVLSNHADRLALLEKIEEINGLVIDLLG